MNTNRSSSPIIVKHLTAGNNFWAKLQPVIKTPGNKLVIQNQVNTGGGVRGQKTDFFVILNTSQENGFQKKLDAKDIRLVSSTLVQSSPVHESVLKGILALAKKGDRNLIDIGHDLVLGQIDLMKLAFPTTLNPDSMATPTAIDTDDDLEHDETGQLDWEHLSETIPKLITSDNPPLMRLEGIPHISLTKNIGILAKNISHTNPEARLEIAAANFSAHQKKLADRISRLAGGQYLRVVIMPCRKSIFIGDIQALKELEDMVIPPEGVTEPLEQVEYSVVDAPPSHIPLGISAVADAALPGAEDISFVDVDKTKSDKPLTEENIMKTSWTAIYTRYGAFGKQLMSSPLTQRYALIEYKGVTRNSSCELGIIADYELCQKIGIEIEMKPEVAACFLSSEIIAQNIAARSELEKGKFIVVTKNGKIHTAIFPIANIPQALQSHIAAHPQLENTGASSEQSASQDLGRLPSARHEPHVNDEETVNITQNLILQKDSSISWNDISLLSGRVHEELKSGDGFRVVFYKSKPIGVAVSTKLAYETDKTAIEKISYAASDAKIRASKILNDLASGKAVALTRYAATQFTIYPAAYIPQRLALKVLKLEHLGAAQAGAGADTDVAELAEKPETTKAFEHHENGVDVLHNQDQTVAQSLTEGETDMITHDFSIAATSELSVPANLAERITQRTGENQTLARIEEVRQNLNDPNIVVDINWNGTTLKLTSNRMLIDNVNALAEYFNLQNNTVDASAQPEPEGSSWMNAFETAATSDGLLIFKSSKDEAPILMTRHVDFFAKVKHEFC